MNLVLGNEAKKLVRKQLKETSAADIVIGKLITVDLQANLIMIQDDETGTELNMTISNWIELRTRIDDEYNATMFRPRALERVTAALIDAGIMKDVNDDSTEEYFDGIDDTCSYESYIQMSYKQIVEDYFLYRMFR